MILWVGKSAEMNGGVQEQSLHLGGIQYTSSPQSSRMAVASDGKAEVFFPRLCVGFETLMAICFCVRVCGGGGGRSLCAPACTHVFTHAYAQFSVHMPIHSACPCTFLCTCSYTCPCAVRSWLRAVPGAAERGLNDDAGP